MKIQNVTIAQYIAEDGTEFYSQIDCEEYEKSLKPFVIKPEWIEQHQKQVAENDKVKEIMLATMDFGNKYILTDLYFELLPQLDFLRKRMTVQRLSAIMRQLLSDGLVCREEECRQIYFIKM